MIWLHNVIFIIAIVMVVEGILPFLSPERWKQYLLKMLTLNTKTIRIMGFISMILGAFILTLVDPTF